MWTNFTEMDGCKKMNIDEIIESIKTIESKLREKVIKLGQSKSAEITGIDQSEFSQWINFRRVWSIKKILRTAKQMEIE